MPKRVLVAVVAFGYVMATVAVVVGWSRQTPHTGWLTAQWLMLYLASVVYPAWWSLKLNRALSARDGSDVRALPGLRWAPVIVGGTSLLFALRLIEASQR